MKKITTILLFAGVLAGSACSRKKDVPKDSAPATDTQAMKSTMEEQQKAIKNASDQLQKERELGVTPTPTASVPPG